jgi:lysophospholipase L1-like esterase
LSQLAGCGSAINPVVVATTGWGNEDVLNGDGAHPTIAGHKVIANWLANKIAEDY